MTRNGKATSHLCSILVSPCSGDPGAYFLGVKNTLQRQHGWSHDASTPPTLAAYRTKSPSGKKVWGSCLITRVEGSGVVHCRPRVNLPRPIRTKQKRVPPSQRSRNCQERSDYVTVSWRHLSLFFAFLTSPAHWYVKGLKRMEGKFQRQKIPPLPSA